MTITTLTTLDLPVRLLNDPVQMLTIYSRALEERPDQEGCRHYHVRGLLDEPTMTVQIDGKVYDVTDVILPRSIGSDLSEQGMICVAHEADAVQPTSHVVFTCYTQYSEWAIKLDVLQIENDDEGTIRDFLDYSIDDKRKLLGL